MVGHQEAVYCGTDRCLGSAVSSGSAAGYFLALPVGLFSSRTNTQFVHIIASHAHRIIERLAPSSSLTILNPDFHLHTHFFHLNLQTTSLLG
jgi:hypothetical protein